MTPEEKYVAAAYLVVFVVVLVYVLIMATKLQRLERELGELAHLVRERQLADEQARAREQGDGTARAVGAREDGAAHHGGAVPRLEDA